MPTIPTVSTAQATPFFAAGFPWCGNHGRPISEVPPEGETFGPCAAAALFRTRDFPGAGGFDGRFFCYCEDVDLALRLRLSGGRCIQVRDAVVRHVSSGLSGARSDFALYHSARNRIWTMIKNVPWPLLMPMIPAHVAVTLFISPTALRRGGLAPVWCGIPRSRCSRLQTACSRRKNRIPTSSTTTKMLSS